MAKTVAFSSQQPPSAELGRKLPRPFDGAIWAAQQGRFSEDSFILRAMSCRYCSQAARSTFNPIRDFSGLPWYYSRRSSSVWDVWHANVTANSSGQFRSRKNLKFSSFSSETVSVPATDEPSVIELPCLPFSPAEVLGKYNNFFAHVVIEPVLPQGDAEEDKGVASFLATYGCLARIENVVRLDLGASVTIRGIGRLKLVSLTQLEPFLKSTVVSLKDDTPKDVTALTYEISDLQTTLNNVQQLQLKLKVSKDDLLQTPLERALQWAEKGEQTEACKTFVPTREERLSFAALQPVAGASPGEQHKLLQERLFAMEAMDTMQRLNRVTPFAKQTLASVAAKVALQSLNL